MSTSQTPEAVLENNNNRILVWAAIIIVAGITGAVVGAQATQEAAKPNYMLACFMAALVTSLFAGVDERISTNLRRRVAFGVLALFFLSGTISSWGTLDKHDARLAEQRDRQENIELQREIDAAEAAKKALRTKHLRELVANTQKTFGGTVNIRGVDQVNRIAFFTIFGDQPEDCSYEASIRRTPTGDRLVKGTEKLTKADIIIEEDDAHQLNCASPPILEELSHYGN